MTCSVILKYPFQKTFNAFENIFTLKYSRIYYLWNIQSKDDTFMLIMKSMSTLLFRYSLQTSN